MNESSTNQVEQPRKYIGVAVINSNAIAIIEMHPDDYYDEPVMVLDTIQEPMAGTTRFTVSANGYYDFKNAVGQMLKSFNSMRAKNL